jgi:DNA mismatch repair protein MutS
MTTNDTTTPEERFAGYTPAMRQFLTIKHDNPHLLILYRMGDFYETFFDDAEKLHKLLGLTLTSRSGGGEDRIPMAGIPFMTLDQYLVRLVNYGLSIGICEQLGTPGKGLMERKLVRIITPGTLTDEGLLGEKTDSRLLAVCLSKNKKNVGLAWLTISSGDFRAAEVPTETLVNEIARISPNEILISDDARAYLTDALTNQTVTPLPSWHFDAERAEKALLKQFECEFLDSYGIAGCTEIITAAGVALEYAAETQGAALSHVLSISLEREDDQIGIDQASRRNLELVQTLRGEESNTLFSVLDHCATVMGSRRLRSWIQNPLQNQAVVSERQETVEELLKDHFFLDDVRSLLKKVPDIERTASRIALRSARPKELAALRDALPVLDTLAEMAGKLPGAASTRFAREIPLDSSLHDLLAAAIKEEPSTFLRDGDVIASGYSKELDDLRSLRDHSGEILLQFEAREREKTGISTLRVEFNSVHGYYIEVSKGQTDKVPVEYRRKQTLKNVERYITPELKDFEDKAVSAQERSKAIEKQLYEELLDKLHPWCMALLHSAESASSLDVLSSFAYHAEANGWVRPAFSEEPGIRIVRGRHPVVEKAIEQFVPNDCTLTPQRKMLIITGPNMGGKSTYMRSVALIVLLAYCGSFVPAESAVIGPVDRILTRIGASDDLSRGLSTFMVEMTEAASILRQAGPKSLVLMDEIGRGTSTFDGLSLAAAIAEDLVKNCGSMTLFATHYFELTQLEKTIPFVANVHVSAVENARNVVFMHEIEEGPANQSYGIAVAKLAGMPRGVVKTARNFLTRLEKNARAQETPQLDLFCQMPGETGPEAVPEDEENPALPLLEKIAEFDLEDVTPRRAWDILSALQDEAKKLLEA